MWETKTSLLMKIVVTSTYSKASTRIAEDSFILILSATAPDNYVVPCANNMLADDGVQFLFNSNGGAHVNDFTYTIGSADVIKLPLVTSAYPTTDCPITTRLFVFDEARNVWTDQTSPTLPWIKSFDAATGTLTVGQVQVPY